MYHATVQKIIDLLTENQCWLETFEHEPVKTSEQAALTRPGYTLHQGAKAMIVKVYPHTKKHNLINQIDTKETVINTENPSASSIGVGTGTTKSDGKFYMLVFPADQKFDSKKAITALGAKNIRFASEAEVGEITSGVQIGGVPPFGPLFNLPVIADPSLFENEKMVFNAGDRGFSVAMKTQDYKKIINPVIAEII